MNCLKVLIVIGLFIFLTPNASAAEEWVGDRNIVTGLGDVGLHSKPTVFNDSGTWKLISGDGGGTFTGFQWNSSTSQWDSNASIVTGLSDVGERSKPEVYYDSGTWKMIAGNYNGDFYGFQWNGTGWESNSSLITGLDTNRWKSTPTVFNDAGTWKLIAGEEDGVFDGYQWNVSTSQWDSNSSLIGGLGDIGSESTPEVFNDSGTWKLISGENSGDFNGFEWNGTGWENDPSIIAGLPDTGSSSITAVYDDSGTWKLIVGNGNGKFRGYELLPVYNVSGIVTNSTGSPIVGAEVTIKSIEYTSATISNTTNAMGYYIIPSISNRSHSLTAIASGNDVYTDSIRVLGDTTNDIIISEGIWSSNTSLITDLGDVGWYSTPEVFNDSGTWKMIAGEDDGVFNGYYWNGTSWVSDSSIVNGLGDVGDSSAPTVFNDSGTLKLISGEYNGGFYGFEWNGTSWVSNSSIVNGLVTVEYYSKPTVFNDSGTWKLIAGEYYGGFSGYQWNTSTSRWDSNASIITGLAIVGYYSGSAPEVYDDSGTWKLISGEMWDGFFFGFEWNTSTSRWDGSSIIASGLKVPYSSSPTVFYMDNTWKLITGEEEGDFYGFEISYTVSGTITNSTGSPIVGANVTVNSISSTTNATGYYAISSIPSDTYSITATASGYSPYTGSVTVSGDTTKDFAMIETTSESFSFTVPVASAQNTALQTTNTSFGSVVSGSTIIIADCFNLTNTGNVAATVNAKFTSVYSGTYGLNGATDVIGGANFSMTEVSINSYIALSNADTDTPITGSNVAADGTADIWKVRLIVPAGQAAVTYSGIVELTFS